MNLTFLLLLFLLCRHSCRRRRPHAVSWLARWLEFRVEFGKEEEERNLKSKIERCIRYIYLVCTRYADSVIMHLAKSSSVAKEGVQSKIAQGREKRLLFELMRFEPSRQFCTNLFVPLNFSLFSLSISSVKFLG